MTTANTIIARALRLLGVYGAGESASAVEAADCLEALNDMIAGWATKRLLIHSVNQVVAPLTGGISFYTVGVGATINTPRPLSLESAFIRIGTADYPVASVSRVEYEKTVSKGVTSIPQQYYYDAAYPAGKLFLWPAPPQSYTLYFDAVQPFTAFSNLTDQAIFPLEYGRMLKYGLAVEMAPEYGKVVSPDVAAVLQDSMRWIKNNNSSVTPARFDFGHGRGIDIRSDR